MKYFIISIVILILLGILLQRSISIHVKAILLLTEEFPQIPLKPLGWMSKQPLHETFSLESDVGKVNADLFVPSKEGKHPVLIVAMGVKTAEKDRSVILHFAQTLARLGYVVLWPRLAVLDEGKSLPEDPETFISAFEYLEQQAYIDKKQISFVGFSVGSSIAMVAASDLRINERVHGIVFFGGYYDIFEYLTSIAAKRAVVDSQEVSWEPSESAVNHVKEILTEARAEKLLSIFDVKTVPEVESILTSAPDEEKAKLLRLSPKENLAHFKSRTFILHEKSDSFVPYAQSIVLAEALPNDIEQTFLLVNLFEHVQPKKEFSSELLGEFLKLYGFLYQGLRYL